LCMRHGRSGADHMIAGDCNNGNQSPITFACMEQLLSFKHVRGNALQANMPCQAR
jgi:hypothetical protein